MNPFTDTFLNFEDVPLNFEKFNEDPFSLTSPDSDSTAFQNNLSPPNNHPYFIPQNTVQIDYNGCSDDFLSPHEYQLKANADDLNNIYTTAESVSSYNNKDKRSMKRKIAKERTKQKQDINSFLEGVDSKFIPEGLDDPNLDEKSKKKLIQMVRNRISAQNSRDRKKTHMLKLEDANNKLISEKNALIKERTGFLSEIQRLQQTNTELYNEIQALKSSSVCSSCRRLQNSSEEDNQAVSTEESQTGGFSGLNSPVLSRFVSGRSFMTFFAFAAVVSMVAVVSLQPSQQQHLVLNGNRNPIAGPRILEDVSNNFCKNPAHMPEVKLDPSNLDFSQSLVMRNIKPLMDNFNKNFKSVYQTDAEKVRIFDDVDTESQIVLNDQGKLSQAIMNPTYNQSFLRRKAPLIAKNLPVLRNSLTNGPHTSTLVCHKGTEVFENELGIQGNGSSGLGEESSNPLDLEKADYLQLFIPRGSIGKYHLKDNLTGVFEIPDASGDESKGMLEVWCKVFFARELSPTY